MITVVPTIRRVGYRRCMRLATFNILNGRSMVDHLVDLDRLADAVTSLNPDVLALQEVDRNQPRSHHADLTAVAADAMGAVSHRFVAALSGNPGAMWIAADGDEQPDSAAYGIALLSRYPAEAWEVVRLAPVPVPVPMWFDGSRKPEMVRDEPRVAVAAKVASPFGPLTVAAAHLTFMERWNGRQLKRLCRSLLDNPDPVMLMGDLNMGPERAQRLSGMRSLASAPTFPAESPTEQLDHVLARGALPPASGRAVRLPLSDHRARVGDLG